MMLMILMNSCKLGVTSKFPLKINLETNPINSNDYKLNKMQLRTEWWIIVPNHHILVHDIIVPPLVNLLPDVIYQVILPYYQDKARYHEY